MNPRPSGYESFVARTAGVVGWPPVALSREFSWRPVQVVQRIRCRIDVFVRRLVRHEPARLSQRRRRRVTRQVTGRAPRPAMLDSGGKRGAIGLSSAASPDAGSWPLRNASSWSRISAALGGPLHLRRCSAMVTDGAKPTTRAYARHGRPDDPDSGRISGAWCRARRPGSPRVLGHRSVRACSADRRLFRPRSNAESGAVVDWNAP